MKRAGPFLEDIRIFLSGFSERDETQMQRVLQSAGAKRMSQIAASVTHIGKQITEIDISIPLYVDQLQLSCSIQLYKRGRCSC